MAPASDPYPAYNPHRPWVRSMPAAGTSQHACFHNTLNILYGNVYGYAGSLYTSMATGYGNQHVSLNDKWLSGSVTMHTEKA